MYKFLKDYKNLDIRKIELIENSLDIKLPYSYKKFISEYNDAKFDLSYLFKYNTGKGYLLGDKDNLSDEVIGLFKFLNFEEIEKDIYFLSNNFREVNSKKILPIIRESGTNNHFFISINENNYGEIYFADEMSDFTFETLHYMAENFEEFMDCIIDEETYEKESGQ